MFRTTKLTQESLVETGGKDFIFAHESAASSTSSRNCDYKRSISSIQGQKCSAASRAYITFKPLGDEVLKLTLVQDVSGIHSQWVMSGRFQQFCKRCN